MKAGAVPSASEPTQEQINAMARTAELEGEPWRCRRKACPELGGEIVQLLAAGGGMAMLCDVCGKPPRKMRRLRGGGGLASEAARAAPSVVEPEASGPVAEPYRSLPRELPPPPSAEASIREDAERLLDEARAAAKSNPTGPDRVARIGLVDVTHFPRSRSYQVMRGELSVIVGGRRDVLPVLGRLLVEQARGTSGGKSPEATPNPEGQPDPSPPPNWKSTPSRLRKAKPLNTTLEPEARERLEKLAGERHGGKLGPCIAEALKSYERDCKQVDAG